jgi:hypothetical protein
MTQAPVTQKVLYQDYRQMGGILVAKQFTITHDDELFATGQVELFELNPAVDANLFAR